MSDLKFDQEEIALLASYEADEWKAVRDATAEKDRYRTYASATYRKGKRVNIRISEKDLAGIQKRAVRDGIPYQTLISSILHKYVSGLLVEK